MSQDSSALLLNPEDNVAYVRRTIPTGSDVRAPRLVGIHFAHPVEDALRVRLLYVGLLRPVASALLPLPWSGARWFLRPLWHGGNRNHAPRESKWAIRRIAKMTFVKAAKCSLAGADAARLTPRISP